MWYKKSNSKKYPYEVSEKMHFQLPVSHISVDILDSKGGLLAHLDSAGLLTIYPGYTWDGATLAIDFKRSLRATLIHDIMCQLVNHDFWPYNREDADFEFLEICKKDRFVFGRIYFYAVFIYGVFKSLIFPNKKTKGIFTKQA